METNKERNIRRIGIPRGILRYLSLKLLKQAPMSGSEIVEQIEDYTDWRPSPGSIYPMISDLQNDGLIVPYENGDPNLKRFKLTEKGFKLVTEILEKDPHISIRQRTIRKMYWKLHLDLPEYIYSSLSDLLNSTEDVFICLKDNPQKTKELKEILNSTTILIKGLC